MQVSDREVVAQYICARIGEITGSSPGRMDTLASSGIDSIGLVELSFDVEEKFGFALEDQHLDLDLGRVQPVIATAAV